MFSVVCPLGLGVTELGKCRVVLLVMWTSMLPTSMLLSQGPVVIIVVNKVTFQTDQVLLWITSNECLNGSLISDKTWNSDAL